MRKHPFHVARHTVARVNQAYVALILKVNRKEGA